MKKKYITILACLLLSLSYMSSFAQGKYYQLTVERQGNRAGASLVTTNSQQTVSFSFPGHSQKEIYNKIMQYIKERPDYFIKEDYLKDNQIVYRDFRYIGKKDSCKADLIGLTYIVAYPKDNGLEMLIDLQSKIFATTDDADLQITAQDDVASIDNKGFNKYQYVQPKDDSTYLASTAVIQTAWSKKRLRVIEYSLAYPESIYNYNGTQIINLYNKNLIERYYDGYITGLVNYIDKSFK